MTDERPPTTKLDWSLWCHNHLRPFKRKWPKGAAMAMLGLFNAALNDDRIRKGTKGQVEVLEAVLNAHRPVCCFLPRTVIRDVVRCAREGKVYLAEEMGAVPGDEKKLGDVEDDAAQELRERGENEGT